MWDVKEEKANIGEVLVGKGKHKKLIIEDFKAIHEYIIMNSTTNEVAYMYSEFILLYKFIVIIDLNPKP
jgi:hypothetical protein